MARFDEAQLSVAITIRRLRDDLPGSVVADVSSHTADGTPVRSASIDITDDLTNAQRNGARNLLDIVTAKVRERWDIPEPVAPEPEPEPVP